MAEVVGLLASIATLIEVAGKTGRTISRIRKLQASPPRYVLAAQNEVERFTAALDLIQDILNNKIAAPPDKAKAELARLHKQAIYALQEFDDFLREKVLRDNSDGNSTLKLRRRAKIKEVFGEAQSEFLDFQRQLVSIKQNLQLVLQALQFQAPSGGSLHLQSISIVQAGITTAIETGDHGVTAAYLEKAVVSIATETSSSSPLGVTSISAGSAATQDDYVVFQMQQAPQGCRQQCPCQCHIALRGSTPRWLQGLMGSVFLSLSGIPLVNRRACNVKGCGGKVAANGAAHLQYVMPTWALPYAIETTATWRTLGGLGGTWTLKIPRFMNTDVLFDKFLWLSQYGKVEDFQELMSTSGMRAFDVFDTSVSINSTLFALAVNAPRADICQMLLENGADISYRDACGVSMAGCFWLKHHACGEFSNLMNYTVLAEAYDTLNVTPGHNLVVKNAFYALADHLRNFPAAITLQDENGFTLLHWAAACGTIEALDVLVKAGADVNARCKRGRTPLMWACAAVETFELSKSLIRGGADVNMTDFQGCNALMWLVNTMPVIPGTVTLLLDAGTDIHHVSKDDMTALEEAACIRCAGIFESCSLLLERGALLDRITPWGWTPVAYAILHNNHNVLKLFIENGALLNTIADADNSTNITLAASRADVYTMAILRDARIQGLPMDEETVKDYWNEFSVRDTYFVGFRKPAEVERTAFQELLDSIIPLDPSLVTRQSKLERLLIPGAFPLDEHREEERATTYSDTNASTKANDNTDQRTCEGEGLGVDINCNFSERSSTDKRGVIVLTTDISLEENTML